MSSSAVLRSHGRTCVFTQARMWFRTSAGLTPLMVLLRRPRTSSHATVCVRTSARSNLAVCIRGSSRTSVLTVVRHVCGHLGARATLPAPAPSSRGPCWCLDARRPRGQVGSSEAAACVCRARFVDRVVARIFACHKVRFYGRIGACVFPIELAPRGEGACGAGRACGAQDPLAGVKQT